MAMENSELDLLSMMIGKVVLTLAAVFVIGWLMSIFWDEEDFEEGFD